MSLQKQGPEQKAGPQRIAATPPRAALFLAVFCLVFTPLCLIPDKTGQTGWFMLPILLPGGLWALLYSLRTTVIADANGLRWRQTFGPWQSATWDDVTDYFRVVDKNWGRSNIIVLRDGKKLKIGSDWNDLKRLEAWVVEHAKGAKASGWLIRGKEGTIQGSHTFTYSPKSIVALKRLMAVFVVMALFMGIGMPLLAVWQEQKEGKTLDWGMLLLFGFSGLFWLGMTGVMLLQTRRTIKDIQERLAHQEHFDADEHGVTFWRDGKPQRVAWSSLLVQTSQNNTASNVLLYRLRTEEQEFSYTSVLSDWVKFREIIALYAPQVTNAAPPLRLHDVLASTEWDNGRRTFHYRTRGNRSGLGLLWSVPIFCALGAGAIVWTWLGYGLGLHDLPFGELSVIAGFALAGIFVWLFLLWRYKTARLVLDRESLTYYGLWGSRRVFFEQIAAVGRDELGFYLETHDAKRPIRWAANLADNAELLEELERRAGVSLP